MGPRMRTWMELRKCFPMGIGEEVLVLDDVVAQLRAMSTNATAFDPQVAGWMADQVQRAADRSQEVADLRAALALLHHPVDIAG